MHPNRTSFTRSAARHPHRLAMAWLCAAILGSFLLASCAGTPRAPKQARQPNPYQILAESRMLAAAMDLKGALNAIDATLTRATVGTDVALRASLQELRALALLRSGNLADAKAAFNDALSIKPILAAVKPLIEFRLLAAKDRAAAQEYAAVKLADPSTPSRIAAILSVLSGAKDVRDLDFSAGQSAEDYQMYLEDFRVESPAMSPQGGSDVTREAVAGEGAPVVVIGEPKSVGADETSVALVRLAFRDALIQGGSFGVVDADSRGAAMDELELSLSGGAAQKDMALGQMYAAEYVASGSVVKTDTGWLVALTFSRARDGMIVASEFSPAVDHKGLADAARRFGAYISDRARQGAL